MHINHNIFTTIRKYNKRYMYKVLGNGCNKEKYSGSIPKNACVTNKTWLSVTTEKV